MLNSFANNLPEYRWDSRDPKAHRKLRDEDRTKAVVDKASPWLSLFARDNCFLCYCK